jgi:hypothetical protein
VNILWGGVVLSAMIGPALCLLQPLTDALRAVVEARRRVPRHDARTDPVQQSLKFLKLSKLNPKNSIQTNLD